MTNTNAFEKVRADKTREANDGFDGSWVAHPDLVPVCREVFDSILGERSNQLERTREDVVPDDAALINVAATTGTITSRASGTTSKSEPLHRKLASLRGNGAVAIHLLEDAATVEISRSQPCIAAGG